MRKFLLALVVLIVLGGLAAGGAWFWIEDTAKKPLDPSQAAPIEFAVAKGARLAKIGEQLEGQGLIKSALVWKLYPRLHGERHDPKAGRHLLTKAMSIVEVMKTLDGPPLPDEVPFTVVEGDRLRDVDENLAKLGRIAPGAYLKAAQTPSLFKAPFELPETDLEGYLYPETYMIPKEGPIDPVKLIQAQLDTFVARFYAPNAAEITQGRRKLHELVVMASILEREEPKGDVRPKVAGVLYKRLDSKTPLGVDATTRYLLAEWNDKKEFLKKLRDPDDPYNTRTKAGLPPTPIGAPALSSLLGALRPEQSQFWYYLHDADHNIHFAVSGNEHDANRKKYNVY